MVREHSTPRASLVLVPVIAALVVLGLLGIPVTTAGPHQIKVSVGAAGDRLREATSFRIAITIDVSGDTRRLPALVANTSVREVVDARNRRVAADLLTEQGRRSIRYGNQTMYVSVPVADRDQFSGKAWASIPVRAPASPPPGSDTAVTSVLDQLRRFAEVADVGPQRVNGIDTEHFHADLVRRVGVTSTSAAAGQPYGTVDLWVSEDSLPIRLLVSAGTGTFSIRTRYDLGHFNEPVSVDIPSPEQVQPATREQMVALLGPSGTTFLPPG